MRGLRRVGMEVEVEGVDVRGLRESMMRRFPFGWC